MILHFYLSFCFLIFDILFSKNDDYSTRNRNTNFETKNFYFIHTF
jgi:hypothetical protein